MARFVDFQKKKKKEIAGIWTQKSIDELWLKVENTASDIDRSPTISNCLGVGVNWSSHQFHFQTIDLGFVQAPVFSVV
ncbi:hypothetical protein QYF36_024493 [Acer negundo]|nr:hypothetical protein QYF36_024493 [Acer negundo]